jgi:hypothetical protein
VLTERWGDGRRSSGKVGGGDGRERRGRRVERGALPYLADLLEGQEKTGTNTLGRVNTV